MSIFVAQFVAVEEEKNYSNVFILVRFDLSFAFLAKRTSGQDLQAN